MTASTDELLRTTRAIKQLTSEERARAAAGWEAAENHLHSALVAAENSTERAESRSLRLLRVAAVLESVALAAAVISVGVHGFDEPLISRAGGGAGATVLAAIVLSLVVLLGAARILGRSREVTLQSRAELRQIMTARAERATPADDGDRGVAPETT